MQFSKEHFQQHKLVYEALALIGYFGINAGINATSVIMEEARGSQASFQAWEPFAWEYSSAFATLLLFPLIAWFINNYPWDWQAKKRSVLCYIFASISYGSLHIFLMVTMRELIYLPTLSEYQFSANFQQFFFEIIYELRKDLWSFCFFVAMISIYRYILTQWLGDVKSIPDRSDLEIHGQTSESLAKLLLVKKLGKEFLIKTKNIEWVEACGNYANLHVEKDIFPMRITMADFIRRSTCYGFIRVHKSFAVNIDNVHFIEPLASGDGEIMMRSGKKIRLSRRFKVDFEALVARR